ncbi:hypothetical protein BH11PLA2_BH11PLA2_38530 [soil metagenome]
MHILHLASDLGPTSVGRRLSYLVPLLQSTGTQTIGNLGGDFPFGDVIRNAGITPISLRIRYPFDLGGAMALRRCVANAKPDVVHLWGEHHRITRFALRDWTVISPKLSSLVLPHGQPLPRAEARLKLGLSETARIIVTVDRFETVDAIRNAFWAIDLMKPTSPDYVLLILGDGPARATVEAFARKLGADDNRARFLGIRNDVPDILAAADVAWNTRTSGGLHFTAEAMAHGLPVVGFTRHAGLSPYVKDGVTGSLAADTFKLAGATHMLFENGNKRVTMGQAGMKLIAETVSTPEVEADRLVKEYASVSANRP